jgi:hypothetical protein
MAAQIRVATDAVRAGEGDRRAMDTFWTLVTIGLDLVIVGIVLWMFIFAPFRVPRHPSR